MTAKAPESPEAAAAVDPAASGSASPADAPGPLAVWPEEDALEASFGSALLSAVAAIQGRWAGLLVLGPDGRTVVRSFTSDDLGAALRGRVVPGEVARRLMEARGAPRALSVEDVAALGIGQRFGAALATSVEAQGHVVALLIVGHPGPSMPPHAGPVLQALSSLIAPNLRLETHSAGAPHGASFDVRGETERLATLGTLAAGIAHEINNPLTYVIANVDYVEESLRDAFLQPFPSETSELIAILGEARDGLDRVRAIVRDLQPLANQTASHGENLSLARMLDRAALLVWNELRHRATFVQEYQEGPMVFGHEGQLIQLFSQLLVNAAQSIPEGAAEEQRIVLRAQAAQDDQVLIDVEDSGRGMSREVLRRVFDPFFTTRPPGSGTGLGLLVCLRIAQAHRGRIEVQSREGQGSRFRVVLPTVTAARATTQPTRSHVQPRRALCVLVIDDEAGVRDVLQRLLSRWGHRVTTASSTRQANDKLRSEHFDVVFCDLQMPDGLATDLSIWHPSAEGSPARGDETGLVLMTGGAFTDQGKAAFERWQGPLLSKPFETDQVREALDRAAPGSGDERPSESTELPAREDETASYRS